MSKYTADKQAGRMPPNSGHIEVAAADYARVQDIIDNGTWVKESALVAAGYIEEEGVIWRAVIKSTRDSSETFLSTLHKAKGRDLGRAMKRYERL